MNVKPRRLCAIEDCGRVHFGLGLCGRHYRLQRGDPLVGTPCSVCHIRPRGPNRSVCDPCNRERSKVAGLARRRRDRDKVFAHYGSICSCCAEHERAFLTIDHVDGGGRQHRKAIANNTYGWLVAHGFPAGFQTLCHNCNWAKFSLGSCPHTERIAA